MEKDVQMEGEKTKTFVPGQGQSAEESFATSFTAEQKEAIRNMVANAKTPQEIEAIELSVQRGIFPGGTTNGGAAAENGDDSRKRKASEQGEENKNDEEQQDAKRQKQEEAS